MLRLSESEANYTKARRALVRALHNADGPRSARELCDDMDGKVPQSTVYRSLATFTGLGIAVPHHGTGGDVRYELAEWLVGHHHHLVCQACGNVDDIELSEQTEEVINSLVTAATTEEGFLPESHFLEIVGRCASCRSQMS